MRVFSADKTINVPYEGTTFEISKTVDGTFNFWAVPHKKGYLLGSYETEERARRELWSVIKLGEAGVAIIEVTE
jgi:hypothetical protein